MGTSQVAPNLGRFVFIGKVLEVAFVNNLDKYSAEKIIILPPRGRSSLNVHQSKGVMNLGRLKDLLDDLPPIEEV